MKGTNTLIVNPEQMCEIVQEWWDRHTYSFDNKQEVISVAQYGEDSNFSIEIDETEEKS